MVEILLDREGHAPLPEGYTLVTNEVDFLRLATENRPLLVRGEWLCDWAETFYRARRVFYRETFSLIQELQTVCPGLTDAQAADLARHLGDKVYSMSRPLTIQNLLQMLYPSPLWRGIPSARHAAEWLVWLKQEHPKPFLRPLLEHIAQDWQNAAGQSECDVYGICTSEDAQRGLEDWLGIGDRHTFPIQEEFPLEIPPELQERARNIWRRRIVESHSVYFDQLEKQPLPFGLKRLAANEVYLYYVANQDELTQERIEQLSQYLRQQELNQLRRRLAPPQPTELPQDPKAVLDWFRREYLPYREWQASYSSEAGRQIVLQSARQFAHWYLDCYPKALTGAPLLKLISFNKTLELSQGENVLTLLIVLDGLHAADARSLLQSIREHTQRLDVFADDLVFSPIPTITQFAKEALFRGVPPNKAREVDTIGIVLTEDKSPAQKLTNVYGSGIYLWRVLEPDRTYHQKNRSENLPQDVGGRLEAEALKVKEIVESVPDTVMMQIVITTDHGRLLGQSERVIPIPEGMQGHGRAAWGTSRVAYPESGYVVEGDVVYLFGERFGLDADVAIPLDESSFRSNDGRTGTELYPHGGLFPEEVIVPWIVLVRDNAGPQAEIKISGQGRARRSGILQVKALNLSDIELQLQEIVLSFRAGTERKLELKVSIGARSEAEAHLELSPWPSVAEAQYITAVVRILQPNQLVFEFQAQVNIESEDIYVQLDNVLEDLE